MSRLSEQQLQALKDKAAEFQQRLVQVAKKKVPDGTNQGAFFATLFQMAAECIEDDVETFCNLAQQAFEEIEAYGQEPQLSEDWLMEVTGEKDNFYFSTENLVSDLVSPPRRKRRKKQLSQEELERIKNEIEAAIVEEDDSPRDLHQALAVAHGENVEHWIETIKKALEHESGMAEFWQLHNVTRLSPVELFLGLLLGQGNWRISQDDGFGKAITVTLYTNEA